MAWLPNDFSPEDYEQGLRDSPDRLLKKTSGEHLEYEAVSAAILAAGRRGTTRHADLRDYLSESQLAMRRSREVMPQSGFPEAHIFRGLYKRAYNSLSRGPHSSNAPPSLDHDTEHHGG